MQCSLPEPQLHHWLHDHTVCMQYLKGTCSTYSAVVNGLSCESFVPHYSSQYLLDQ